MQILTTDLFRIKNKFLRIFVNCAISVFVTTLLTLLVRFTKIPNPNLFLMMGLVIITVLFGFIPGIIPTLTMIGYSLWFFSTNNDFATFNQMNLTKVWVAVITGLLSYTFVGLINLFYEKNTLKMMENVRTLHQVNEELKQISKTDAVTKIKNRYSLKNDLQYYVNHDIQVMIVDIDNFKTINDSYGHVVGDAVLSEVGRIAKEIFEDENVYRYGGDEFLVIKAQLSLREFEELVKQCQQRVQTIVADGKSIDITLSIGYTFGIPSGLEDLKRMIAYADKLMYQVKSSMKNNSLGKEFDINV